MNKIVDEEVIKNYNESLRQKYNAVCLDIDGTITKPNSINVDKRIIPYIAKLLKKNIPVVFITGRGETGVNDFIKDVSDKLQIRYRVTLKELKKMYFLSNDGSRMFYTNDDSKTMLDHNEYLVPADTIICLGKTSVDIVEKVYNSYLSDICDVKVSIDKKTGRFVNTRIVFKVKDEELVEEVFKDFSDYIKKQDDPIVITKGIYKGNPVIQFGLTTKELAVKKIEKIIGVSKDSMIRIGDCGDETGNDYSMLNCPQGFSVNSTSQSKNSCFPIIDDNGKILTGVEATMYMLDKAKILPAICLEGLDEKKYKSNYAKVEKQIDEGRIKQISRYNNLVNKVFKKTSGIDYVFDSNSGSIKIPMYDWEIIDDNNPLKNFYEIKNGKNQNVNILRDDKNVLLRGSGSYYYFLANRQSDGINDYTSLDNIEEWIDNYLRYFYYAFDAVEVTSSINSTINKKLILGILDNIRNVMLVLINAEIYNENKTDKAVLISLDKRKTEKVIDYAYYTLLAVHKMMIDICTDKKYKIKHHEVLTLINQTTFTLEYKRDMHLEEEDKDYSRIYRAYREIDNFAENYLTVDLVHNKNRDKKIGICGLTYGGLELPIIYKTVNPASKDILLFKFSKDMAKYDKKHSMEIRNYELEACDIIGYDKLNRDVNYILADDNILTAKTMQLAINSFYDLKANVQRILIVRYPSINRSGQMFGQINGAADYNQFFGYIQGLLFPSPYTFIDDYGEDKYLDSLGVFDRNRQKILECIYKNHDYAENTEVAKIKKK